MIRTTSAQARNRTEGDRRRDIRQGLPGRTTQWVTARNGLSWKPYVYQGTGRDAFTGEE